MPGEGKLPDEYERPPYQLVVIGVGTDSRREVIRKNTWIRNAEGTRYRFQEVVKVEPPADQLPIFNDSPALYRLRVIREWSATEQSLPVDYFPNVAVQENPLAPHTFEARVLSAMTEYQKVKASGLGVDRHAQMLMDAVAFLIDERLEMLEKLQGNYLGVPVSKEGE